MNESDTIFALRDSPFQSNISQAHPFLKWAGGKGQLVNTLKNFFPPDLTNGEITKYCEPFLGGGALFFYVSQAFRFREIYISDINKDLMLIYKIIRDNVDDLIVNLLRKEKKYKSLDGIKQSEFYYQIRDSYNSTKSISESSYAPDNVERAAQLIFMNRTCFNGLFRTNSNGQFNVPFGKYKNPRICQSENLKAVSFLLQNTIIMDNDFENCDSFVNEQTFIYLDPPYRPISKSSNFTEYTSKSFDDQEQIRLSNFFRKMDAKGAKILLSNSDPRNSSITDGFFDDLYSGYNIFRVMANRMINCNSMRRGPISEILITNYPVLI